MTTLSVLKLFPETKEQQDVFVEKLKQQVLDGYANPLEVEVQMYRLEQVIKKYRADKELQEACLNEAEKYNQKSFDFKNSTVKIREVGVKYGFDVSEDWRIADHKVKEAEEVRKAIEARLKTASDKAPYIDIASGWEITGISKSSTTRVVIEINKK